MTTEGPTSEPAEVTPTAADSGEAAPVVEADAPTLAAPGSITSDAETSARVEPEPLVEPAAEPVVEPVAVEPAPVVAAAPASAPVVEASAQPVAPVTPAQQVVYVQAPRPFIAKGNRGFGVLIALLSTIIFAAVYAVALVITEILGGASADFSFVTTLGFYAPVVMFAVGFILLVLIVNRAGWAAHVVGSLLVGLVVFFGGTGLYLLLHASEIPSNEIGSTFQRVLFSVAVIVASLLAREVSLWMGFVIAARGRRVRARNVEAKALYDQEIAEKRAEYERANARTAAEPVVASRASVPVGETGPVQPVAVDEPAVAPPAS
jgi:hypothetical protein